MKTFEEFQATRTPVEDLSKLVDDVALVGVAGFAYRGALMIEERDGAFALVWERESWTSDDLAGLEFRLWAIACEEWPEEYGPGAAAMAVLTALNAAAVSHWRDELPEARGPRPELDSDDFGMLNATADELFAWVNDLEFRVGFDVTELRAAVGEYVAGRDGEPMLDEEPVTVNRPKVTGSVDVLAVIDDAVADGFLTRDREDVKMLKDAGAALAELIEACSPLVASLVERIDADNAMTPQAVMVRRAADALARVGGAK